MLTAIAVTGVLIGGVGLAIAADRAFGGGIFAFLVSQDIIAATLEIVAAILG